jgi:hypothetical protein
MHGQHNIKESPFTFTFMSDDRDEAVVRYIGLGIIQQNSLQTGYADVCISATTVNDYCDFI